MFLLKNCRLIPELTEGFTGRMADIIVDHEKITDICETGSVQDFEGKIIDAAGRTVLPGFFDLHCHVYLFELGKIAEMDSKEESYTFVDSYNFAREYLRQGYTTLRDAGCAYNVTVKLMKLRDAGLIDNVPDIISSGRALTPTNPSNDEYTLLYEVADGSAEVMKAARKQFEAGNDIIKYMVTGCYLDESGIPGISIATEEELRAAVQIAKMRGSYVMGHAHGAEGIKTAIRAGLYTIEHGSFIDDEAIEMLKNRDDCFLVPTGSIGLACMTEEGQAGLSDSIAEKAIKYEKQEKECINKAYAAGLKMGFGSDIDYATFKNMAGLEFIARREWYDFKPMDILLQATKYSAEIAGLIEEKGTIKVGKNAELVIINGNPDEDIDVMRNLPRYVIFRETVIDNTIAEGFRKKEQ